MTNDATATVSVGRAIMSAFGALILSQCLLFQACTADPESPRAERALRKAVAANDIGKTIKYLSYGVDPAAEAPDGATATQIALRGVTGQHHDEDFFDRNWAPDDPMLRILREVMRASRATTYAPFEESGPVDVAFEVGAFKRGGLTMMMKVLLETEAGPKLLVLSHWETDYSGFEVDDQGMPIISPGTDYHVIGAEKDGVVEVYCIEQLSSHGDSRRGLSVPRTLYLTSTWEKMRQSTWIGEIGESTQAREDSILEREKGASAAFMEEVQRETGAERTASGLIYIETIAGSGEAPSAEDTVKVHYNGTLRDGKVFDSSIDRGEPSIFPLDQVIACWSEGLQKMKIGGKSTLLCHSDIAYGDRGAPPFVKPGAALAFEVELIGIEE